MPVPSQLTARLSHSPQPTPRLAASSAIWLKIDCKCRPEGVGIGPAARPGGRVTPGRSVDGRGLNVGSLSSDLSAGGRDLLFDILANSDQDRPSTLSVQHCCPLAGAREPICRANRVAIA